MAIKPVYIHKGIYTNAFNILLLSDGFLANQEAEFLNFCKVLGTEFFKISPFKTCKNSINILAHFSPSTEQGIENRIKDTAYNTYFDMNDSTPGTLNSDSPNKIQTTIEQIEFNIDGIQRKMFGPDIWLNPENKSYGAIGIVAHTNRPGGVTRPGNSGLSSIFRSDWHYFIFTQAGYANQEGGYQYIFVHELAHAISDYVINPDGSIDSKTIGLAEEYETTTLPYLNESEPDNFNVTAINTVINQNTIDKTKLKWKRLLTKEELENIQIIRKPNQEIDENYHFENHDWRSIQLIEGGYTHSTGIFRSNWDCKMRKEYDKRSLHRVPGTNRYQYSSGPDFCRVCRYHIIKAITEQYSFSIEYPRPENIKALINNKNIMQKIIIALINHIDVKNGSSISKININIDDSNTYPRILHRNCARATANLAILLTQNNMSWHELRFGIAAGHCYLRFYDIIIDPTFYQFYLNIDYPNRRNDIVFTYLLNGMEHDIPANNTDINGIGFSKGFVGTIDELKDFYSTFIPVATSWVNLEDHQPLISSYIDLNTILDPIYKQPRYEFDPITNQFKEPKPNHDEQLVSDIEQQIAAYKKYKELLNSTEPKWLINNVDYWQKIKKMFDPLNLEL